MLIMNCFKRDSEKNEKYKLFDNRRRLTFVNKKPSDGELKIIDVINKTYLDNLKDAPLPPLQ